MKYAVIEASGTQYLVKEGQFLETEKIVGDKGQTLEFDKLLLYVNEDKVEIGKSYVAGKKVYATIEEQAKDQKIYVYKFRAKSRYRRKTGHRQSITKIKITKID